MIDVMFREADNNFINDHIKLTISDKHANSFILDLLKYVSIDTQNYSPRKILAFRHSSNHEASSMGLQNKTDSPAYDMPHVIALGY